MNSVELIEDVRGDMTVDEFVKVSGISREMQYAIKRRDRGIGIVTARKLSNCDRLKRPFHYFLASK